MTENQITQIADILGRKLTEMFAHKEAVASQVLDSHKKEILAEVHHIKKDMCEIKEVANKNRQMCTDHETSITVIDVKLQFLQKVVYGAVGLGLVSLADTILKHTFGA